jgi:hypothetical protein
MVSWLKGLFGGKPEPKKKAPPGKTAKTYNAPTNRAEVIAAAMAVHRRERAHAQEVLQKALHDLQAKPPRPTDLAGMTRLLSLRQAVLSLKGHMAHDLKRYQVLAGVKQLMESAKPAAKTPENAAAPAKKPQGRAPSQGGRR